LYFTSADRHAEAADELFLYKTDISSIKKKKEQTFLYLTVLSRSTKTIAVLLNKRAVVSAQNLKGSTALYLAADQGQQKIINLLINNRAKVRLVNKLGYTLLHCSACLGYRAATKLLVNKRLVITTKNNNTHITRDLAKGSDRAIKALNNKKPDFYIYKDYIILL
jgi:ankyrin repeat protein